MDEATEIALLRQQRSQLREQLESRRRRSMELTSSPSPYASPGADPRSQNWRGGVDPDHTSPAQPPHSSYQQYDGWRQQPGTQQYGTVQYQHQHQRHFPPAHPRDPYASPARPPFPPQEGGFGTRGAYPGERGGPPPYGRPDSAAHYDTQYHTEYNAQGALRGSSGGTPRDGPPGPAGPVPGAGAGAVGGGGKQGGHSPHSQGSPMQTVQGLVLECLVGPNVELPMDSTAVARRIKKRQNSTEHGSNASAGGLTAHQRRALEELGAKGGGGDTVLYAVECAIEALAQVMGPQGALVESEAFSINGVSQKMVLSVDRRHAMEAFPWVYGPAHADSDAPAGAVTVRSDREPREEMNPSPGGGLHPGQPHWARPSSGAGGVPRGSQHFPGGMPGGGTQGGMQGPGGMPLRPGFGGSAFPQQPPWGPAPPFPPFGDAIPHPHRPGAPLAGPGPGVPPPGGGGLGVPPAGPRGAGGGPGGLVPGVPPAGPGVPAGVGTPGGPGAGLGVPAAGAGPGVPPGLGTGPGGQNQAQAKPGGTPGDVRGGGAGARREGRGGGDGEGEEGKGGEDPEGFLESLLSKKTFKEAQQSRKGEELMELLQKPTAKETARIAKFKTKGGSIVKEYCSYLTREDCIRQQGPMAICDKDSTALNWAVLFRSMAVYNKLHFRRIIAAHTDVQLGDCSFLDTCRHMKTCKHIHYEVDPTSDPSHPSYHHHAPGAPQPGWGRNSAANNSTGLGGIGGVGGAPGVPGAGLPLAAHEPNPFHPPSRFERPPRPEYCSQFELGASQWLNCDIRTFEVELLGQFGVIMADPPWDIHMELPYGTMSDDEMRALRVQALQTDGLIFLWVTGRAMELGRECLELWGYKRVEELIWVKTNQLQKVIRTGRTGHWLNHSKEHCLVGVKGNPLVNRNIDTDVLVAEVRETSRKPDEMYSLIERISPRTRKVELFARMHNTHAGWISLGNQLNGTRLVDPDLRRRFREKYPGVEIQPSDAELKEYNSTT